MGIDSKVQHRKQERLTEVCRSVVCGGEVFIPDTEYSGDKCQLTCDINNSKQD